MPTFYSIGFFGAPNFGDELLCSTLVNHLREADGEVFVMTRSAQTSSTYTGLQVQFVEGWAPRPEYLAHLGQHLRAVRRSDLILIGGGGLISDHYSWQGAVRYFTDVCWAILLGRRYAFVGLGVSGLRRAWLKPLVRFIGRHAASVYVRDQSSAQRLKALTNRSDVVVGPDLASLASLPKPEATSADAPFALVNFREKPPINEAGLCELIETLVNQVGSVVLLPAQPSDVSYYQHVVAGLAESARAAVHVEELTNLQAAIGLIDKAQVVVAERLHVNVVAAQRQKRLLVLEYEDKVGAYMASVGTGYLSCKLDEVSGAKAEALLNLSSPDWSTTLEHLRDQAREVLDQTVSAGLASPRHGLVVRLTAALYLLWLMPLIAVYGGLILIKQLLFGRGAIRKKKSLA